MDGVSVFSDHICELGEGPSYDPATDTLFWFDIVNGKLLEKPLAGALKIHDLGVMASAITVIDDARQLIATEIGLQVRDVKTGKLTAFIGQKADRLAVTSAWKGKDEKQRAVDPQAGMTFLLDIPVNGRFEPRVLIA